MTAAPNLATVDAALARARELTARRLARDRKPASWYKRLIAGKLKPRRPFVPRDQRLPLDVFRRDDRDERRACQAERPVEVPWSDSVQARYDALYTLTENRAQAEVRYAGIRELVAGKLERVATWARAADQPEPGQFTKMAEQLRRARRVGYWGEHLDTGEVVMRFRDRSGLTILDPSEARQRQAELVRRLVPELQRLQAAGLRLYYAVASEPNVPSGSLAWGKAHLFERFRRVVLGRNCSAGALPEIVGAFAVQEDPLSADHQSWNVHLNLILVVDPKQCTPLDDDLIQQLKLELRGNSILMFPPRKSDPTPAGCLSYAKLHYLWGSDQFHVRPLEARSSEQLGKKLLEVVKYSAKWVSTKQLDELAAGGVSVATRDASPELVQDAPPDFLLGGARHRGRGRPAAPGVTQWPEARVAEWIRANRRFRRVRGWGLLYRLAKDELPPDPDDAGRIRWLGRVFISPRGAIVHGARLSFVSSTHGDKFACDFPARHGRSPGALSRAGPAAFGFAP